MTNNEDKSSCLIPASRKQKAAILLGLIAVGAVAGVLVGNVYSGLIFGLLLGLPLTGAS